MGKVNDDHSFFLVAFTAVVTVLLSLLPSLLLDCRYITAIVAIICEVVFLVRAYYYSDVLDLASAAAVFTATLVWNNT
jgi:hypothetical protein